MIKSPFVALSASWMGGSKRSMTGVTIINATVQPGIRRSWSWDRQVPVSHLNRAVWSASWGRGDVQSDRYGKT